MELRLPAMTHLRRARSRLDRASYRAQHQSLKLSLGVLLRGFHKVMQPRLGRSPARCMEAVDRRFAELLAADLSNVERGAYPRDLLFQMPFREYVRVLPEVMLEAPRILLRRYRGGYDDLPAVARDDRYPRYYRRNFHWQSDGWFSDRSARLYDASVELLFAGTADIMRRMAIPPVAEARRPDMRILDLACGTGRFLLQMHRAIPEARLYGLDLSPYYVDRARQTLSKLLDVSLHVENAEHVPLDSGSFDVVTSVFLFHELPRDARRAVAREALRLLRPGGRFIVCDSAQLSESPEIAFFLEAFQGMYHEPFYKGYLRDDLTKLLSSEGFQSVACAPHFVSKVVVGTKPAREHDLCG